MSMRTDVITRCWLLLGLASCCALAQPSPETPGSPATDPNPAPPAHAETPLPQPPEAAPVPEATVPAPITTDVEVEIRLRGGRPIEGMLVERTATRVTIRVAGIETSFPADQVEGVIFLPPVEVRYEQLRRVTPDDDVPGIISLARWLIARDRYDLAQAELGRAIKADPEHPTVRELSRVVEEHLKLPVGRPRFPGGTERERPVPPRVEKFEFPVLTADQINLIRVYEVDLADPPRMSISRDVILRFMDAYAGQKSVPANREGRDAFLLLPKPRILETIFEVQAREFYGEVKIQEHPRAMRLFRANVQQTWLTNACATTQCHGGEQAGRLWLTNKAATSDASTYTNFLILERFRLSDGLPLIDYTQPARSALLQYGLPRDQALFDHPPVEGLGRPKWRPVFTGEKDPRFQAAMEWINAMYRPRPEYPIEYQPPVPGATRAGGGEGGEPAPR